MNPDFAYFLIVQNYVNQQPLAEILIEKFWKLVRIFQKILRFLQRILNF